MTVKGKRQVRIYLSHDKAFDIQLWGSKRSLSLPQACALICENFNADVDNEVLKKLDEIIDLLSQKEK